ncbi:MAG: hypothetical protein RI557_11305, partial [Salibacter sp.]|nr:hypothetical protein [Salibacter sp.]
TNITYSTTGATGATFSGLPAGVTGNFSGGNITISGTPTATGTFNYTITLTGGCGTVTETGTIDVTPDNTISLTSAAGTDNQTVCENSAITNITYSTTGATGATFSGLPAGVTGNFSGGNITISGTPTATGTFNYTITLTGGCGTVTETGTIQVTPAASADAGSDQTICEGETVDLSTSGTTPSASNNAGLTWTTSGDGSFSNANILNPIYTPGPNDIANGSVTLTLTATGNGSCGDATDTMTITINAKPTTSPIFHN